MLAFFFLIPPGSMFRDFVGGSGDGGAAGGSGDGGSGAVGSGDRVSGDGGSAGGSGSDGSGAGDGVKEFWTETARQAKTQWWENLRLI